MLGWLQPSLTRQFLGLAFHPKTHKRCPELLCQEAKYSNANPPHMFRAFYRQVRHIIAYAACGSCTAHGHVHLAKECRSVAKESVRKVNTMSAAAGAPAYLPVAMPVPVVLRGCVHPEHGALAGGPAV